MKVKICGLRTLESALFALDAGAELLGFNFYPPSPRYIAPAGCAEIVSTLRQRGYTAGLVGVFVNTAPEWMSAVLEQCHLDLAQLSGDEPPATLAALPGRAYKALRPASLAGLQDDLAQYAPSTNAPAWLLDANRPGGYGGTGQTADWRLARNLAGQAPILLAGGLTPDNVAEAVRQVQPWGVDVASGVESAPGIKDPARVTAFIHYAHTA
jgi:phosphoribosylanthranilate isomerase